MQPDPARLYQPVGRHELTDVVQEAVCDREPGAADDRQQRDDAAGRGAGAVDGQHVAERDPEGPEGQQRDQDQEPSSEPAATGRLTPSDQSADVEQQADGRHRVRRQDLGAR